MNIKHAANCMAELGHPKRLTIYKLLVKSGPKGLLVGEIATELKIPGSTLSHHLKRLIEVKLVSQTPEKQAYYCKPNFKQLNRLIEFLTEECCQRGECNE